MSRPEFAGCYRGSSEKQGHSGLDLGAYSEVAPTCLRGGDLHFIVELVEIESSTGNNALIRVRRAQWWIELESPSSDGRNDGRA